MLLTLVLQPVCADRPHELHTSRCCWPFCGLQSTRGRVVGRGEVRASLGDCPSAAAPWDCESEAVAHRTAMTSPRTGSTRNIYGNSVGSRHGSDTCITLVYNHGKHTKQDNNSKTSTAGSCMNGQDSIKLRHSTRKWVHGTSFRRY